MANEEDLHLLKGLYEKATKNLDGMLALKSALVKCQHYEMASKIHQMEIDYFPMTEEETEAVKRGRDLQTLFGMDKISIKPKLAWTMEQLLIAFKKKKGKFSMRDAAEIHVKAHNLFLREHSVTKVELTK